MCPTIFDISFSYQRKMREIYSGHHTQQYQKSCCIFPDLFCLWNIYRISLNKIQNFSPSLSLGWFKHLSSCLHFLCLVYVLHNSPTLTSKIYIHITTHPLLHPYSMPSCYTHFCIYTLHHHTFPVLASTLCLQVCILPSTWLLNKFSDF